MDLYDIGGDHWYIQSTSTNEPDFPLLSLDGCAALGSDGKTWEIYMYSCSYLVYGNDEEFSNCQDIWVLTIPAFRWFRLPATRRPIIGHGCHIVGKQLVTVAGNPWDKVNDPWDLREQTLCTNTPFRVYDLESLQVGWTPPPPNLALWRDVLSTIGNSGRTTTLLANMLRQRWSRSL